MLVLRNFSTRLCQRLENFSLGLLYTAVVVEIVELFLGTQSVGTLRVRCFVAGVADEDCMFLGKNIEVAGLFLGCGQSPGKTEIKSNV